MRIEASTRASQLQNPFGIAGSASAEGAHSPFGPSVVRGNAVSAGKDDPLYGSLYGPDGRLNEDKAAERRTLGELERRDQAVRSQDGRNAAPGGVEDPSRFIYQTGPDGKRYAIGAKAHVVEKDTGQGEASAGAEKDLNGKSLSAEDQQFLDRLKARDDKVRAHEHAHLAAAAGQAAGPPSYTYQTGPDGKRYAVGGSVDISMSYNSGDPEASLRSARTAYASAMATGEPSSKDMAAASQALSMATRARRDGLEKYAAQAVGE